MNAAEVSDLLSDLVAIDSVNPDLIPGARGEGELAQFIAGWLGQRGLEVHLQETAASGRPNVVAVARGQGNGRSLILNSHMDTVGVVGMENPHSPRIEDVRLYGRGAQDTKGALAAFMLAAARAAQMGLKGDLILAAVADEEYVSAGTEALVRDWKADAAIVGEPTDLNLVIAHKGFAWMEVETFGVAAHGSRPGEGVDAILKMGKVLSGIDLLADELLRKPAHALLGNGSIHTSLISGGQEISSYPAYCKLSLERRTLPGETVEQARSEIELILDSIAVQDPGFIAKLNLPFARSPFNVPEDSPIVQVMQRHTERVLSRQEALGGVSFWTDAALLIEAGIPTVVFGPTGAGLHSVVEWVDLESVRQCTEVTLAAAVEFCG